MMTKNNIDFEKSFTDMTLKTISDLFTQLSVEKVVSLRFYTQK